ncbi:unnamed protein product, partial [Vitis vinifera]|uniref:Protein kinase domain-containing protein n=1 Tax=Vitis vinifera TaxID=29760 RepID=D7TFY0_VITVI
MKPKNILLIEKTNLELGTNFCPNVSDFGLAKLMGSEHSHVVTMRNLDMTFDAEEFFYPRWAFKEMNNGMTRKVADR